jgi:hypothetical protein
MNDAFIGAAEYVIESLHDLLAGDSKYFSSSDSSRGSHHHSWECFVMETPEGRVESVGALLHM